MKKILLATTALALSAGVANAQALTISGEGRMGVRYDDSAFGGTNAGSNYMIENRLQFNFNVAVEGDHGLTFGAYSRARMQMGGPAAALSTAQTGMFAGSRVWVESNGLRLTFGNVDGAIRGAGVSHGYAGGCTVGYEGGQQCGDTAGLLGVSHAHNSTAAASAQRVRVDYSMGDTRIAVSHDRGGATELGVRTSFDAFTVALGYTNGTGNAAANGFVAGTDVVALSGHYDGGSWGAGLLVARGTGATNFSLSASAQLGGGEAYGYIGRVGGSNAYGLNYGYGLGGGANLVVGAERVAARTTASVGVVFGF
ncbi:porin [Pararhodobacter oceanensis]|uniref:porin n=1 Tax=Pararhodobacter oceanensis TaxID=2172121 RepID=UPI003A8FA958